MANDRAVIGASVAGLLAARAAAHHFARVTVVDSSSRPAAQPTNGKERIGLGFGNDQRTGQP
jgi:flavin-dependent dehydrogenase